MTLPTMPRRKIATRADPIWRVWPQPSLSYPVANLAQREGCTVAEMVMRLVREALKARVAAVDPAPTTSS
jgi:hypothetical protein